MSKFCILCSEKCLPSEPTSTGKDLLQGPEAIYILQDIKLRPQMDVRSRREVKEETKENIGEGWVDMKVGGLERGEGPLEEHAASVCWERKSDREASGWWE